VKDVGYLVFDSSKATYWCFTDQHIYELVVQNEDRNVWLYYLDRNMFELAAKHAQVNYASDTDSRVTLHYQTLQQRKQVILKRADYYFSKGRFQLSAKYYAESDLPVEEVILKFVDKNEKTALKEYLSLVLDSLDKNNVMNTKYNFVIILIDTQNMVQTSMLVTWLVDLKLDKVLSLSGQGASKFNIVDNNVMLQEKKLLIDELQTFLTTFKVCTFSHILLNGRLQQSFRTH
jgi:hypothetical protein